MVQGGIKYFCAYGKKYGAKSRIKKNRTLAIIVFVILVEFLQLLSEKFYNFFNRL